MISFFLGTINSNFIENTIKILKKIKNKKTIIIVPEQCSFWAEKQAIKIFEKTQIEIEILSFSRLTYKIFQKYGGLTKDSAQKCDKLNILNLTILQIKKNIPIYSNLINKPGFLEIMLQTIELIKKNKTSYKHIKQNLEKIKDKNLNSKIKEFWLIFKTYNLKLNTIFNDSSDNLIKANKICKKFNSFSETQFFFTQFFYFSQLQLNLISTIAKQTDLYFNFYYTPNCEIFNTTSDTINKIKKIAKKFNITTIQSIINLKLYKSKTMLKLEKILIKHESQNISKKSKQIKIKKQKTNDIKIFAANSIFDEVEWAIIEILKLTRKYFNFSDITLLTTNLALYKTAIISSFEKFQIPFFLDDLTTFQNINLLKCCEHILNAATNQTDFIESCVSILKCNLTKFSTHEISIFENYLYTWNITKSQFNSKFKKNPQGILKTTKLNETDSINLKIINKIRKTLNMAIAKIQNSENNSKNFAINIIYALNILGIQNFKNKIQSKIAKNQFKLEWNSLITLLENIYKITKQTKINLNLFNFLFKSTAQNLNFKQIPPTLNCVLVGSIENTIPTNPKIVIILGANEFNLPKKQLLTNQLFSNFELHNLKKIKINFGKTTEEQNNLNKLTTHRVICSAILKTYFSFTTNSANNKSNQPCNIIKIMQKNFNLPVKYSHNLKLTDLCLTESQALKQLALHYNDETIQSNSLKYLFEINNQNSNKNEKNESNKISNIQKKINIFKISSSQVEQFFTCPFAYYCRYILKINSKPKANFKKSNLGLAFHFVLEKIISEPNFKKLNQNQLKQKIKTNLTKFSKTNLINSITATKIFKQNINKNTYILTTLAINIQNELKNSNFTPTYFEQTINNDAEIKNLKIKVNENTYVEISGKIDRIDTQIKDNKVLFRIIDYKTSQKNLNYFNIILGLNLQMLLYAMVVLQNKPNFNLISIEYVKILGNLNNYLINDRNPSKDKINKKINSGFFQTGLLFQNYNFFKQANPTFKIKKSEIENKLLNANESKKIFKFITKKIKTMMFKINNFDFKKIQHCTTSNSNQTNCSFCPYSEICNSKQIEQIQHDKTLKKHEFFNLISKELIK